MQMHACRRQTTERVPSPNSSRDLLDNKIIPKGLLIGMEADMLHGYKGNKHKVGAHKSVASEYI